MIEGYFSQHQHQIVPTCWFVIAILQWIGSSKWHCWWKDQIELEKWCVLTLATTTSRGGEYEVSVQRGKKVLRSSWIYFETLKHYGPWNSEIRTWKWRVIIDQCGADRNLVVERMLDSLCWPSCSFGSWVTFHDVKLIG